MKEIIYYERDENKRPVISVCLVVNDNKVVISRGVAKCSKKRMPVKKRGRDKATERARKAVRCGISESDWSDTDPWKAVFNPTLTPYEQTLIAKSV